MTTCFILRSLRSLRKNGWQSIHSFSFRICYGRVTAYEPVMRPLPTGAIIGGDDRRPVSNTLDPAAIVHGHLEMVFANGKRRIGSGTMVNYRHVLTAGHCVFSKKAREWAKSIKFTAAQDGNSYPIRSANAIYLLTVKGWKDRQDPNFDMGMLILDRDLGKDTGWYGISVDTDELLNSLEVNVTGYPGDKGGKNMYTMEGRVRNCTTEQFTYTLDTNKGQSGSGVWTKFGNIPGYYCVGIHTQGLKDQYNSATRITEAKFDRLVSWMNKDLFALFESDKEKLTGKQIKEILSKQNGEFEVVGREVFTSKNPRSSGERFKLSVTFSLNKIFNQQEFLEYIKKECLRDTARFSFARKVNYPEPSDAPAWIHRYSPFLIIPSLENEIIFSIKKK